MIGLIPAAGAGTRLQPLTKALPKEMLQVGNKPIIEHVIDQFTGAGISKVYIIVGQRKEAIMNYLGNGSNWNLKIAYLFQENKEGLAKAIYEANNFIHEPFAVVLGDTLVYPKEYLKQVIEFHKNNNCDVTLTSHEVADPKRFGVLEVDDSGKVLSMEEKPENPKSNLAIVGMYVFNPSVFDAIEKTKPGVKGEYQITDSIKTMLEENKKIMALKHADEWFDVGTKESYLEANKVVANRSAP